MSTVTITVDTTTQVTLAAGVTQGVLRYTATDASATVIATNDTLNSSTTFTINTPGDYIAAVERLDSNGAALAAPIKASFTVPPVTNTADVPATITVALT